LKTSNLIKINPNGLASPLCYPFLTNNGAAMKEYLHANKIFVATYWPEFLEPRFANCTSQRLANNIIALPIDQRYSINDMQQILDVFNKFSNI